MRVTDLFEGKWFEDSLDDGHFGAGNLMRFHQLMERTKTFDSSLLNGLDMSSFEGFMNSLHRVPKPQIVALQEVLDGLRRAVRPEGTVELYHGTPQKRAEQILHGGLQLTKGERAGFMGSTYTVDNQGIFLTDSKRLAGFFGDNRSDGMPDNRARVFTCYVDPSHIVDLNSAPREIIKAGLAISAREDGSSETRRTLSQGEAWKLLDHKEFVDLFKQAGYTGVRFKEQIGVRRAAGDLSAHTYFVFDPASITVLEREAWTFRKFYDWLVQR